MPDQANAAQSCIFCRIAQGAAPATIVREWPDVIAFADADPIAHGHVQVIPKRHVSDATEDTRLTGLTMTCAAQLACAWPSSNILTSVGKPAKQAVFHLHIHVIPRRDGDGLMLPWGTVGDPHDPHWCRVAERLQRELDEIRHA